ncbi:MAG: hypothetical protein ABH837_01925 [bacterium]
MLTIKEAKKYLKKYKLTDAEIQKTINILTSITENVISKQFVEKRGK